MAKLARDIMTLNPAFCSPNTMLDQVAKMMVENNCGEIPIVDAENYPIGVVTDRDIVCRAVAEGKNPSEHPAASVMTTAVVTAPVTATIDEVVATMADRQIRRIPVVDESGYLVGIIAQADIASEASTQQSGNLVREVSKETRQPSR